MVTKYSDGDIQLTISERLADELREWVQEQQEYWPQDTAFQRDLLSLARQLDAGLPTADDVRGILSGLPRR